MQTVGRDAERAALADLITSGGALVIEGDPGIGKTALLDAAVDDARREGFRVLRCSGLQNASPAGFEALHELLHPVLPLVDALPPKQRSALLVAFAMEDGPAPDRLVVSLAALGLLEEAAGERPVFVAVEDAQWVDPSSVAVLGFVAKRLSQAHLVLVATSRAPDEILVVPRLVLGPVDADAAEAILDDVAGDLPAVARSRILSEAGGNPLALRELAAALREHGPDRIGLESRLPTTKRLERAFLDRVADLPERSRRLLLLAAASDDADLQDVMAAARTLDIGVGDLEPLESTGLISVSGTSVRFRHPLVRSAVEGAATASEWTNAHLALAGVVPDRGRAAWHRASATLERDESVAAELDEAADRARRRGAQPEAVRAYQRAAALSTDVDRRARRLALAAETARSTGMSTEAVALLEHAEAIATEPETVADVAATRLNLSLQVGIPGHSRVELAALSAVLSRRPEDSDRRVKILWGAAIAARGRMASAADQRELAAELDSIPTSNPLKTVGLALLHPPDRADELRAQLPALMPALASDPHGLVTLAVAAEARHDLDTALAAWTRSYERFHEQGETADQTQSLRGRAGMQLLLGRLREGLTDAEYAVRMARDTGQPMMAAMAHATVARANALLGDVGEAQRALDEFHELAGVGPLAVASADARWAAGLIALGEHRYRDALVELTYVTVHPARALWAIADRTEAAVRAGRPDMVLDDLRRAETAASTSSYLTALTARSRALLADDESGFRTAVEAAEASDSTIELARTHLLYGEWLRRKRRPVDARSHLGEALRRFDVIGARTFAERAAAELRAAGEAPVRADAAGSAGRKSLTPQELQVAQLAAQGLSNKEIADRVYLSHRTVSTHLYRAYPKLGIAGRAQLAAALADR
ncbi:AAA family ATPase [Cryptosporangium phraense]|uniref:AAA family ATPase n=1 Tax=Cryptosporangium phraense TaxID=2593070 RepID=A0A545AV99_9ACTN|nr:LuxR family transcriptional regulator [Cryptosporangium phraense]TQS45258.1 AAA family ATPase [Cryptosporangium phraense]